MKKHFVGYQKCSVTYSAENHSNQNKHNNQPAISGNGFR